MERNSVVLTGMAGAGKSTVGSALARILNFAFTDLDQYIRKKEGLTIQEIIDTRGEEALLQIEDRCMRELKLQQRVVSPGGSIIYHDELMEYLRRKAVIVFLDETFEHIEARLKNAPTRGIVGFKEKPLRQIFEERYPVYVKYADITIRPDGKTPNRIAADIARQYRAL